MDSLFADWEALNTDLYDDLDVLRPWKPTPHTSTGEEIVDTAMDWGMGDDPFPSLLEVLLGLL